eukprot:Tbor_TRINITY_DN5353_c0_g4::TRINITY_DN5353_c0_g4_i1::g.4485::m.4485/K02183/CALM; calmodulin
MDLIANEEMEKKTEELGREYLRRVFLSYDREGDEEMSVKDLPTALRVCGMAPTEEEMANLVSSADPEKKGNISFSTFLDVISQCFYNYRNADDLRNAFNTFDPNCTGVITATDLRIILANYGDKMTDTEINTFFEEFKMEMDTDGNMVYEDLIPKLIPDFFKLM